MDDPEERDESETPGADGPPAKRRVFAIMRRAFDDLDVNIYAQKRARRHRRQRFVRALRKLARLCASCGDPLGVDDVTTKRGGKVVPRIHCSRCLNVDKKYKDASLETVAVARYVDEFGRPMRLKFTPKMLPVYGPRHDGSEIEWPACESLSDCMTEVVRACGAKDSPGCSCPKKCPSFKAPSVAA